MFALTVGRLMRNCAVVRSPDLAMLSRLYVSTGFGPTSSAVGIFEPVTMTRSACASVGGTGVPCALTGPVGAAAGGAGGVCAAMARGMARSAAKPLRHDPNVASGRLIIVGWSLLRPGEVKIERPGKL